MKTVMIWCGAAANHKALANKIASEFTVAGIVVENKKRKKPFTVPELLDKVLDRTVFRTISKCWSDLMAYYQQRFPAFPSVKTLFVSDINTDEVYQFSKQINADLVIVSGTSLIRKKLLSVQPSVGIINLHTGLSPYVKGGPNCTNWCIANGETDLIGNTIMWIDAGIDSGNIITTKQTDVSGSKTFLDAHIRVMQDAHQLYLDAIRYLLNTDPPYISIPQSSLGKGNLYLTKMWTSAKKYALLKNIRSALRSKPVRKDVEIVPLPGRNRTVRLKNTH